MFSFLKRTKSKQNEAPDSTLPEAERDRMTLEERMAYRREMLYQSIRESLLQLQVISSMYKFRVMNLDARQHRFVAMIEVTSTFEAKINGLSTGFNQIEDYVRKRTIERYGVTLDTIFWRVNEAQTSFVRSNRAGENADAARSGKSAPRRREVVGDVAAARQRLARGQVKPVAAEDGPIEDISVRHLEYDSEQAPLEPSGSTGGTQYGQL